MKRCIAMILLQKWVVSMAMVIYGLSRVQRCVGDDGKMLLSPYQMHFVDLLMITVVLAGCYQLQSDFIARNPGITVKRVLY